MEHKTHYPSFNVMDEKKAWDNHTQSIVNARLSAPAHHRFLDDREAELLQAVCGILVHDSSPDVLRYVIEHIDQTLHASLGESQRKEGVPAEKDLIRNGLQSLEKSARSNHSESFLSLDPAVRIQLLKDISTANAEPSSDWIGVPQQPFFQKVMSMTIEAYCSHPIVWSEIGYAGPAYPRGYVRTQLGQLDPWEAKTER